MMSAAFLQLDSEADLKLLDSLGPDSDLLSIYFHLA